MAAASPERRVFAAAFVLAVATVAGVASGAGIVGRVPSALALPAQFEDRLVTSVPLPTGMAFTPDARLLIATQPGRLRVVQGGGLVNDPALDLSAAICSDSERGLLGVAVDPSFSANRYVYLYYTFKKFGACPRNSETSPVNRVSRFTLSDANVVDPASETVLVDNIPSPNGNHNAGDLEFGKDGNLYITTGDGGCHYSGDITKCNSSNTASRDTNVLVGKVLRIMPSGGIPAGNPFQGPNSARCNVDGRTTAGNHCQETFAWGLRNPFRLAFDPNAATTRFFINDVGQSTWEEIDEAQAGADYGWNVREGFCRTDTTTDCGPPPAGMTNPVYAYGHGSGCASLTGGAFVPAGIWPASYDADYLYGDYVCGDIFRLEESNGSYTSSLFASAGAPITLTFGPYGASQALYYATYNNGGEIRRIAYTGTVNRAPTASFGANPAFGPAPLTVHFDASASSDPDAGDTLTYLWDFGDGATTETSVPTTSHTYSDVGTFTAQLRVRDNHGATSDPDTERIDPGNTPPTPTITTPAAGQLFAVAETVTLQGSATDTQDGPLPDSRLSWRVLRHHGTSHTHPWLPDTSGNNVPMPAAPAPEDILTTETSYLEVRLTATDSHGLSATTVRDFSPRIVNLDFRTVPSGLELDLFGAEVTSPYTLPAWEDWQLNVSAPRQTDGTGRTWIFDSWSDGGAASHTITTGTAPSTYTATFHENRAPVGAAGTVVAVEDTAKTVTLQATDADGDALAYGVSRAPAHGSLNSPSSNQVVYTPAVQYNGADSFGYTATDGDATSAEANVAVTVTEVNDAPTAATDSAATAEDTSVLMDVRANDSKGPANESAQTLTIANVDDPQHGSTAIESGQIRFTPDSDYFGGDSFSYRVCDNGTTNGSPDALCANGTVDVNVTPVNDPPVAVDDAQSTGQDTPVTFAASLLTTNDIDVEGAALTVVGVSNASNGTVSLSAGQITFTPTGGFSGLAGFDYTVSDGSLSDLGHVAVNVGGANRAPVASAGSDSTAEDTARSLTMPATDADGDLLTFAVVVPPAHGTLGVPAGPTVLYTPAPDYNGADSFTFRVTDGSLQSNVATFSINVTAVNDPPAPAADSASTAEDAAVVIDVVANDSPGPADEAGQRVHVGAVGAPAHGTATVLTSGRDAGKVRFEPAADYNGPDSFTYQACDDGLTAGLPDPKCSEAPVAFAFSAFDPPLNAKPPRITGRMRAGTLVHADGGQWLSRVLGVDYEWLRCTVDGKHCSLIPTTGDADYVLRAADIRRTLRVRVTARNRFGASWALSAAPGPVRSPVTISQIVFDTPGRSRAEWIVLRNAGPRDVQLEGWTIGDADRNVYRFGRLSLGPHRSVTVETGRGAGTSRRRYWRHSGRVWDNGGDNATLRTPNGAVADVCAYRRNRSGAAVC